MICLEVVDVLAEDERPQIFAKKLDDIERIVESRPVSREPILCKSSWRIGLENGCIPLY